MVNMATYLSIIILLAFASCHVLAAAMPEVYEDGLSEGVDDDAISGIAEESPTRVYIRSDTGPSPTIDDSKYYQASDKQVGDPEISTTHTDDIHLFIDLLRADGDVDGALNNAIARDTGDTSDTGKMRKMLSERRIPLNVARCITDVHSTIDSCKRKVNDDVSACKQKARDAIDSCKKNAQKEIDNCKKNVADRVNKCKEDVSREIDECKKNAAHTIDRCKKNIFKKPFCEAQRPILYADCERRRIKATQCEAEGRPATVDCEAKRPALMASCEAPNRVNVPKCEFGRCRTPCCEAARVGERLCEAQLPIPNVRAKVRAFQRNCMDTKCKGQ